MERVFFFFFFVLSLLNCHRFFQQKKHSQCVSFVRVSRCSAAADMSPLANALFALSVLLRHLLRAAPAAAPRPPLHRRGRRRGRHGTQGRPGADLAPAVVSQIDPGPGDGHGGASQGGGLEQEERSRERLFRWREAAAEQEVGEEGKDDRLFFSFSFFCSISESDLPLDHCDARENGKSKAEREEKRLNFYLRVRRGHAELAARAQVDAPRLRPGLPDDFF